DMTAYGADGLDLRAGRGEELVVDAQKMLSHDIEVRLRHEVMHAGDAGRNPSGDRNHGESRFAAGHSGEGVFKDTAGERFVTGKGLLAGDMRNGPRLPLLGGLHGGRCS